MQKRISKKIYKCKKQTTKKYLTRPSPPYPAAECPNKIMRGNDGNKYISYIGDSYFGTYKWKKYTSKLKNKNKNKNKKHDT